jgi:transposase
METFLRPWCRSRVTSKQPVRMREPERRQGQFVFQIPEDQLAEDHPARILWRLVETLELSGFVENAKAVEGQSGRDRLSVKMLLTLWLYAISRGVSSAREIERLTKSDDAFRWIVGDQTVSHATLSSFRVGHRAALEQLMTDILGVLLQQGLVELDFVAQDGTRIRASASAPSFRSEAGLQKCLEQAALHVKAVMAEADDPEATSAEKAARLAGAKDIQRRVQRASEVLQELKASGKEKPRASTTDSDARTMKMGDGGFRPAYNIQLATAGYPMGGPRTIVGVRVTNEGTDMGSLTPMLAEVERRTGQTPHTILADAGHANHECICNLMDRRILPLVSVPEPSKDPGPNANFDPNIDAWREVMQTEEAQKLYRNRAGLCELPNAHFKGRFGMAQLLVRSLDKVTCVVLIMSIASNLLAHGEKLLNLIG